MKFIGKLLIYLLVALLIVVLAFYFLLQTRWGASQVSSWITVNTDYELNFDLMDHRFSSPSHILLENVTFGRDGKPATLVAKKVDIGLSSRQITDPLHMDAITLFDGTLNLSPQTAPLPFQADRLQLNNMAFNSPNTEWDLQCAKGDRRRQPVAARGGERTGEKCANPDERRVAHPQRHTGQQRADSGTTQRQRGGAEYHRCRYGARLAYGLGSA